MESELSDLIEKRKKWVESSKENGFDFYSILAGLYNDPSHFIYEILQNADDEGAKEVRFELFEDRLDIYHNGKDFDLQDIEGVSGIGISKKKEDLTAIGKFGVGFKSVFAVTETPYIFSGKYKIKIEDFVVPLEINTFEQVKGTLIRLPFNHKLRSKEEIFALIFKRLENIGPKTMLFLKNIEEIKWETPTTDGHYLKSSEPFHKIPDVKKVTIISSNLIEEYIVMGKPIKIADKDLKAEVAYKLTNQDGKEIIIPESDSKLVVYFPTERVTYLNFLIQGPYKTTPNRENIPMEDKQNKAILEETANLVSESLSIIKELGYLDINFLNLLPINPEWRTRDPIYSVIYDKVKEKLFNEELLPTSDSKYAKAENMLLARGKELIEFLNSDDIQYLFNKKYWLDSNITYDKTRELWEYLNKELDVPIVDFESFARKITAEFLHTKSDEWIIDFYIRLLDQQSLWSDRGYHKGILRTKPIIRLENGEHIAPFDNNGKIQVYLPLETKSNYKTVKRTLSENEKSLKFLKQLGLTKPDLYAEITEFILPKYQIESPVKDEQYFDDFEKLLKGYESIQSIKKEEFVKELSNLSFIYSVKNGTDESRLLKASECYFSDDDLKEYFRDYQSVYFVSSEIYEKFGEESVKRFLKDLGVEDKPRRIKIDANLSLEEKYKLRNYSGCTKDIYQKDYEYEGLENFINNINPEKSYLLWKLLLKSIENLSSSQAQKFFEGEYSWFYYSQHITSFEAKFLKIFQQKAWLIDKNNNFKKPSEISFSELSDKYIKGNPNIDILIKALKFKPEIIKHLPEEDRRILEITKEYGITSAQLEKILSERSKKLQEEEKPRWEPNYKPNEVTPKIREVEPDKIVPPEVLDQVENPIAVEGEKLIKEREKSEKEEEKTPIDKKAIGRWGEEYVYNALKREYQDKGSIIETDSGFELIDANGEKFEVIWLNKNKEKGAGYDFAIKKNGSVIEYIEVKTKTQEAKELIEVTGTQWEFARKLFDQDEGEKYYFYVILNAGKENAEITKIRNPIKLWKEGRLYAHPVNFQL